MPNVESFWRGELRSAVSDTQAVPFTLNVSQVPNNTDMYFTVDGDSDSEEIFYFTTKTGTVGGPGTLNVTGRGYNKHNATQDAANYRPHAVNSSYNGSTNHIVLNQKAGLTEENAFTELIVPPTFADDADADASWTGGTAPNGASFYSTAAGAVREKNSGVWANSLGAADFAATRNVAGASATAGELFRDTGSSNDLAVKDHGGTVRNFIVNATGKFDANRYDIATTADVETGTNDTKPVTSRGVRDAMATDGEAAANTDESHYVNPKQLHAATTNAFNTSSTSFTYGTNYQASVSGFVMAVVTGYDSVNQQSGTTSGYSDSSATPTTLLCSQIAHYSPSAGGQNSASIMFPVKKSDYWRVDTAVNAGRPNSITIRFVPMQ